MHNTAIRSFLSYVHDEGGFVAQVAKRLTQARVVMDRQAFRPGDPLQDAIRKALGASDMFVLFASEKSISSTWVTYEMNEAEIRRLQGDFKRLLVLTTDHPESRKLLPTWLQVGIVGHAPTPARAADAITAQIVALESGVRPSTLFLGRDRDLGQLRTTLIPAMGVEPPRSLILHGFPGIGRRTLGRKAVESHLSLEGVPVITLAQSDSLDWLHLELVSRSREFNNQDDLAEALEAFRLKSDNDKGNELAELLIALGAGRSVPIVVDEGAMLMDDDGNWRQTVIALLRALAAGDRLHLVLVTPRAPSDTTDLPVAVQSVNPIDQESTRLLLTQALRLADILADPKDVATLAPYIGGYPPAAQLLVDAVRQYGVNIVTADVAALKDLTQKIFTPLLEKLNLSDIERKILRVIAPFRELPIQVLASVGVGDPASITQASKHLSDIHLLVPGEIGIALSPPARHAVMQRYGDISGDESRRIAEALRSIYWKPESKELIHLTIVDAVAVALAHADDVTPELSKLGAYELPSALMRIAKDSYDARNWDRALSYAERVLVKDERREDALVIAFKASVRLERWGSAENILEQITRRGLVRRHYLRGFMEWKRGDHGAAIESFRSALRAGDRNLAVKQHLAYCLFLVNRPKEARAVLDGMPIRTTNRNRYFLDLVAQVLLRLKLLDEAKLVVEDMRRYGFDADHWHRLAHIRFIEGDVDGAIESSRKAIEAAPSRNEVRAMLVEALITKGLLDDAQMELDRATLRSRRDRDLRERLLCKILVRRGDHQGAEAHWREVKDQGDHDARQVRIEILNSRLAQPKIPNPVRLELEAERDRLRAGGDTLAGIPLDDALDPD